MNDKGECDYIFIIMMVAVFGIFLTIMVGGSIPIDPYTIQIKSLNDGSQISGHFTLGSGYIKQDPVFIVYERLQNEGYVLKTLPADDTIIYEDNPSIPYIRVSGCAFKLEYEIHVPSESIIQQYALDGKL